MSSATKPSAVGPASSSNRSAAKATFKVGDIVRVNLNSTARSEWTGQEGPIVKVYESRSYPIVVSLRGGDPAFGVHELDLVEAAQEFDVETETFVDPFKYAVFNVFEEAESLLLRKHEDYGPHNIAKAPGGPINGIRVRLHDKFSRLDHLEGTGNDVNFETIRDTYLDAMNYCAIALLVIDGDWPSA